ncbi:hypothetical protein B0T25DRAFT_229720 [Lasiosphaeria hispida]|uniref:Transcription factor domain-containing protein n=1 Tax=Lasiosphaeria hispida TaxID=260671 RepID=A0AAJ0HDC8_9PEZI|nr:hypothetical protein B0T25DRAFT_229720 [Lasiosphaeria hispida]
MGAPKRSVAVKFVGQDATTGLPMKRKQVHQACDECKRRKKRCPHAPDSIAIAINDTGTPSLSATDAAAQLLQISSQLSDDGPLTAATTTTTPSQSPAASPRASSRRASSVASSDAQVDPAATPFLGDTNPEGVLVEATMANMSRTVTSEDETGPGFWGTTTTGGLVGKVPVILDDSPAAARVTPQPNLKTTLYDVPGGAYMVIPGEGTTNLKVPVTDAAAFFRLSREAFVQELGCLVCPSDANWEGLRGIYQTKIHPIFPIFEAHTLTEVTEAPSRVGHLIKASVCLAAASDRDASKYLSLNKWPQVTPTGAVPPELWQRSAEPVMYLEYSQTVVKFIKEGLRELQARDSGHMLNSMRIMALTCMFWQPAPSCRFEPLNFFAVLVSMVHTYGIHLRDMVDMGELHQGDVNREDVARLFKCLYALDRLTSALSGRPIMFHNYDLLMTPRFTKKDSPSFKLFMSLILLLDQVIELYRPYPKDNNIEVPVLERFILDAGAQYEPDGILATLEVLYHTVCVLSVRMRRDRFKTSPEGDTASYNHLPSSMLNARRSHSSDRIVDILKEQDQYKLSPMPFIPYALALSLSVAYRKWRFSRTPMFRTRGKENFKEILPMLSELGKIWTSARINSNLGDVVMANVDKPELNTAASSRKSDTPTADTGQGTPVARKAAHKRPESSKHRENVTGTTGTANLELDTPNQITSGRFYQAKTGHGLANSASSGPDTNNPFFIGSGLLPPDMMVPSPSSYSIALSSSSTAVQQSTGNLSNDQVIPPANLNPFSLDDMDTTMPFQTWDPTLLNIDLSFGSNLDPGNPFGWGDYSNGGNGGYSL